MSDKKTAIVTGASHGIGAGLVEAFLEEGHKVVATSRMSVNREFLAVAIVCAALLIASPICAQQPAAPNPLDTVPDRMPFDVPYGTPISLERAQAAINAAVAEAKKRDWKMNVAVVDSGGNLVAFQRMDGAQLASIQIAEHKARTAATFRRETKAFENSIQLNNFNYLLTLDGVIASRGGIPLVAEGKLIGAIGCSGGSGSQDEVVCKAGVAVTK
jgi:glc operon protein GlcG